MMKEKTGVHTMQDHEFMGEALALAREAAADGEVPVGCVIVRDGQVVGRGRNRREKERSALAHAEIEAIDEACRTLGGWRLWDCTLYVTLEPCSMCAGAILNARIPRVVFGASDRKYGAVGSVCSLFSMEFNHHPVVESGLRAEEAAALMEDFFRQLRLTLRDRPKWRPPEK
jgi:tRNA(adenine34) deaminase